MKIGYGIPDYRPKTDKIPTSKGAFSMGQIPVPVPLLNANEPEARLVALHVKDGQRVEKDALLFTIETTKAAADVEAPAAGFVRIVASSGESFAVGDTLAFITSTPDEALPQATVRLPTVSQADSASM